MSVITTFEVNEGLEMENSKKIEVLETIIPLLKGLKSGDWHWIDSNVRMRFNSKAAQCTLDGSDLDLIKTNIKRDWIN